MRTDICAVRGDHPASGTTVTSVTVPGGYVAGHQVWFLLSFCGDHDPDLSQYPVGTQLQGKIQIGLREE